MEASLLAALSPVILLLAFGVATAITFRAVRLGPIVGYLVLGIVLGATGLARSSEPVALLAELGVIFLLFDVGLHFSLRHVRQQLVDVVGLGPLQVLCGTLGLGVIAMAFGLKPGAAFFVGATLALSSTAVVARLIAERHQQSCPVGQAATGILVFQDIAAIFLLVIATALGTGTPLLPALGMATGNAVASLIAAMLCARFLVQPLFDLVARSRNEEVFTAMALLIALAASWVTGTLGLSLTLGAFLGGIMLADTPYRTIIQSEVKPFRGLLLGFFFVHVGLTLQIDLLRQWWLAVIGVAILIASAKIALNAAASLAFRWSVPGSIQLGFLLAQGSEFALVIFTLPSVRAMVGAPQCDILIAAVVLSLGATPQLADQGRLLAGRLRRNWKRNADPELQPRDLIGPVFIVGMGQRGRAVADALNEFDVRYAAIDSDPRQLRQAIADGYHVVFGDLADPRIWEPAAMQDRRISVLTQPSFETSSGLSPVVRSYYPNLTRIAVVESPPQAARFATIGLLPVVDSPDAPGLEVAVVVLTKLGMDPIEIDRWAARRRELEGSAPAASLAAI